MNPKLKKKKLQAQTTLKKGDYNTFSLCAAVLNAQILLGKKRKKCMNYIALFMALHL